MLAETILTIYLFTPLVYRGDGHIKENNLVLTNSKRLNLNDKMFKHKILPKDLNIS